MDPNDIFIAVDSWDDIALASQGNITAATRFGYRLVTGLAGKRDINLACYYFILAAQGVADASPWILFMNIQANSVNGKPMPDGTLDRLSALARAGDVIAMTLMGRVYEWGWGGTGEDIDAAKALLAASPRFALAKTFLGELFFRKRQTSDAQTLFQQASEKNETRALVDLALIHVDNHRVVRAKQMLRAAVDQNSCRAMYRLGLLYKLGTGGVETKPKLALGLFQRAASMGYPPALELLRQDSTLAAAQ